MTDNNVDQTSSSSLVLCIQDVCGVSRERALELLVACGGNSVERAIDLYFQGTTTTTTTTTANHQSQPPPKSAIKRKQTTSPAVRSRTPKQQATLSSFFGRNKKPLDDDDDDDNDDDEQSQSNLNAKHHDAAMDIKQSSVNPPLSSAKEVAREKKITVVRMDNSVVITDPRLQYAALAEAFSEMVGTTKRNAKLDTLKKVLTGIVEALGGIIGDNNNNNKNNIHSRQEDGNTLCCALELILGAGSCFTLQVSGSAVSKAILAVTGASSGKLREAYRRTGDLGDAAEHFVRNQRLLVQPKPLSIVAVHEVLQMIASQQGKGSQNQRHTLMVKLLRSCKSNEMKFLVRTLLGNMRLGANVRTVLAALAMSIEEMDASRLQRDADTAAAVKAVQDTFDVCPRLDKLSLALLCGGVAYMKETCVMEVGTPVNPMLANPAHSFDEVERLMKMDSSGSSRAAVAEWKYDGVRCQAHYDGVTMKLYSRHMLETTDQFPDAVKAVLGARNESATSFIVDSEIVGVEESPDEPGNFRLLPFQDLSSRRGDAQRGNLVRIRIYVFDLIFSNGESLAKKPLWQRQRALRDHFHETVDFNFAQFITLPSYDEGSLREFLEVAVKGGAEGLMVKLTGEVCSNGENGEARDQINAISECVIACSYESGVRSQTWLKLKRDYVAGFADTIDVVPIGAWYGNGRKAQKRFLSPVLLAVYDEDEDVFRSISRCMSFTDAMYTAMREFYFHGTPYPDGVGTTEDPQAATGSYVSAEVESGSENAQDDDNTVSADEEWSNCYTSRPSALVVTNESPPIWFKPMEVFEVSFADLTLSKTHTAAAGMVDPTRGVALRFPRFKRRRPDKRIDQATTTVQIAQLFAKQTKQGKS
jgi:DNA ligase 1